MTNQSQPPGLYARVLGERWSMLPEPLKKAHRTGGEISGQFKVTLGSHWLARKAAGWFGLPSEADAAATLLRVSVDGDGERWDRKFDGVGFATRQWMGADESLIERFHEWELAFALEVGDAALVYKQLRARLCVGPIRIRVPLCCAPCIRAKEVSIGGGLVSVEVNVELPIIGLLINYDGQLDLGEVEQ